MRWPRATSCMPPPRCTPLFPFLSLAACPSRLLLTQTSKHQRVGVLCVLCVLCVFCVCCVCCVCFVCVVCAHSLAHTHTLSHTLPADVVDVSWLLQVKLTYLSAKDSEQQAGHLAQERHDSSGASTRHNGDALPAVDHVTWYTPLDVFPANPAAVPFRATPGALLC